MCYFKAKHNKLIVDLIQDPNYTILENGNILNSKGKALGFTMKSEQTLRSKQYRYIKYKGKAIKVHRVIYAKFVGELRYGLIIHHKDDNGLNNHYTNLEQVSQGKNMKYKVAKPKVCDIVAVGNETGGNYEQIRE